MAMNTEFADWYRTASVAPPAELLEQRWSGVEQATEALSEAQVVELLRLFVLRPDVGYETPTYLDKAFRDHDTSFPTKGNVEELRVLAGAILRNAIERKNKASIAAAYGLVCSTTGRRLQGLPTKDHVTKAQRFLAEQAMVIRGVSFSQPSKATVISKERLEELLPAAHFAANQTPALREPLIVAMLEQSTKASQFSSQVTSPLWHVVQTQREELNLLWWLQNSYSKDLSRPFSEILSKAAACVFPVELSDLTMFIPGPSAILGMIVSALKETQGASQVSVKDAVNGTPRDWRTTRSAQISAQALGALCPIHFAFSKSLETDGDEDWIPAFKKQSDILAEDVFETRDLAYQTYCERMFVRALSELKT